MSVLQSRRWAEEGGGQGGSREEGGGREALAATPNDDDAGCHNCETLSSRWSMIYLMHVDFGCRIYYGLPRKLLLERV